MDKHGVFQLMTDVSNPETARMTIYGDIVEGGSWLSMLMDDQSAVTSSVDVAQAISDLPDETKAIEVHINSYGGSVSEGVAIYNALRESGKQVTTVCDGFAASIASVIFMAGTRRVMRPASLLMLHNPWMSGVTGNAKELRKQADDLDVIAELSKTAYLSGGGLDAETLDQLMDAETWVKPEQAVEWGLATEVSEAEQDDAPAQAAAHAVFAAVAGDDQGDKTDDGNGDQHDGDHHDHGTVSVDVTELADAIARQVKKLMDEDKGDDQGDGNDQPEPNPASDKGDAKPGQRIDGFAQLAARLNQHK